MPQSLDPIAGEQPEPRDTRHRRYRMRPSMGNGPTLGGVRPSGGGGRWPR
jgi:hypothetical protein